LTFSSKNKGMITGKLQLTGKISLEFDLTQVGFYNTDLNKFYCNINQK